MSRERGQATVELVAAPPCSRSPPSACTRCFVLWAAQSRAQGIADQAAVLVAEGRPVPASLRRDAGIRVRGRTLVVTLHVSPAGGLGRTDVVARAALP